MQKSFYFVILLLIGVFGLFIYRTVDLSYAKHEYYMDEYKKISEIYVSGNSAPRGRILDIKGRVIVDNIGINEILYHKPTNVTLSDELEIAKRLVEFTNFNYKYSEDKLKDFYMLIKLEEVNKLVSEEELKLYSERKITKEELQDLKKNRITEDMLNSLSEIEKYSSYFYFLMNDGYMYDNKVLLKDISDELYASILEANLGGVFGEVDWSRVYNYGETLKSILGTISNSLPKEKGNLLSTGYTYSDKVGISGLEEYYEEYLKGEKAVYKIENNNLVLVKEAQRGNDLTLEIDIDIEQNIVDMIKNQIIKGKKEVNTEFYRESYVMVSDPLTGALRAIAGVRLLDNGEFQDVSINVIKNAYTVGSVVKAASISVGYQNKVIDINSSITDQCVKLANIPAKCSYKNLGRLNDIRALSLSSNAYQFIVALGVAGYKYQYNMKVDVTEEDFNKYRSTFASFGLGNTTGIDLPNESSGLKGSKIAPDLLMNLAIGQYDLYTPTSLIQYINTVASNGARLKLNLMHSITSGEEIILENQVQELNKVELEEKYFARIQMGLREVIKSGTGYWYVDQAIKAAGKTGTSESYIDINNDGKMDAFVLSNTFLMYAPYDNPKYSLLVISPNTSNLNGKSKYRAPINRLLARNISNFLFSSE